MFSIEESIHKNFRFRTLFAALFLSILSLLLFHFFPGLNDQLMYPAWFPASIAAFGLVTFLIPLAIVKALGASHRVAHAAYFFNATTSFIVIPILLLVFSRTFTSFIWIAPSISFLIVRMYHNNKRWMRVLSLLTPGIAYCGHALYWNLIVRDPFRPEALIFAAGVTFLYIYSVYYFMEVRRENRLSAISPKEKKRFFASFNLTPREEQIVEEILTGYSTKEIAARFPIAAGTIKTHTKNIYKKMGVNTRLKIITKFLDFSPDEKQ
ncbi:MAG: helix-turn-helix transcriptional regulator [Spirochaetota bacterium]